MNIEVTYLAIKRSNTLTYPYDEMLTQSLKVMQCLKTYKDNDDRTEGHTVQTANKINK